MSLSTSFLAFLLRSLLDSGVLAYALGSPSDGTGVTWTVSVLEIPEASAEIKMRRRMTSEKIFMFKIIYGISDVVQYL